MKRMIRILLACCLLAVCPFLRAQRLLTLEDAVSIAFEKSLAAYSEKNRLEDVRVNYKAVKLGQLPALRMSFDLPRYSRALTSYFDPLSGKEQFFSINNTTVEGRMSIDQPIAMTNGRISVSGSLFGRKQLSGIIGEARDYYSDLYISLSQPLFGFNSQKAALDKARINLEKGERDYAQAKMNIVYNITSSFYNLYKSKKRMEIQQEQVRQVEESYDTALNKYKAGLIAEVDAMELEVDLAQSKNDLFNAKRSYEELQDDFKLLIGLDLAEQIDVTAMLDFAPIKVTLEDAFRDCLENRPDYQNAKADLYLEKLGIREIKAQNSLQISINANYGINRSDGRFAGIFRNFFDNRSINMSMDIPVFDWGKNRKLVDQAKANLRLSEMQLEKLEESIMKEIKSSINGIQSIEDRVKILEKSVGVAEKSFGIKKERFAAGTITSFEFSQAQIKMRDMKLNLMEALIDYEIARADLERKTLKRYH